jgi:high-affinity nickel-transport protein
MRNPAPSAAVPDRKVLPSNRLRTAGLVVMLAGMHLLAWGVLLTLVVPHRYTLGSQVFGVGLGVTAYTLGMRHAFDADHIAAIDNTTRKLMAEGRRPHTVGFWFALGHSSMVIVLAAMVAAGAHAVTTLTSDSSGVHRVLSVLGTLASGGLLYLIGLLNLAAFVSLLRIFRRGRRCTLDEQALDAALASRGLLARALRRFTAGVTRPGQMFGVGMLFGLGFDTATEVTLLVLAGTGAAAGLPWYGVVVLPLLFAAGMSLFDTLDGTVMTAAYRWAFANPIRKTYYNLTITGLSVAVALGVGTIELVTVLHDKLRFTDPATSWVAGLDLNNVGFLIAATFVLVWAAAVAYWKLAGLGARLDEDAVPFGHGVLLLRSAPPIMLSLQRWTDRRDAKALETGRANLEQTFRAERHTPATRPDRA